MSIESAGRDELTVRVGALEVENRRYRRFGVAALVVLVGLVSLGQTTAEVPSKVVRTQNLEIVGADGKARIVLGFYSDGTPMIELRREDQSAAVGLLVGKDGSPAIACLDKQGKARALMGLMPDGWGIVAVADASGAPRVSLNADQTGNASFRVCDPNKVARAVLGSMTINDSERDSTRTTSPATLTLLDKSGTVIYQVPR